MTGSSNAVRAAAAAIANARAARRGMPAIFNVLAVFQGAPILRKIYDHAMEDAEAALEAARRIAGPAPSRAALDVLAERQRQITAEGYSHAHDDGHELGELGLAAALYAIPYEAEVGGEPLISQDAFISLDMTLEIVGGWNLKPEPDIRKRKVKAAALLIAEIERLDRAEGRADG